MKHNPTIAPDSLSKAESPQVRLPGFAEPSRSMRRLMAVVAIGVCAIATVQAAPLLSPTDDIFAYDLDTGGGSNGSSVNFTAVNATAGQEAHLAIDGSTSTKHMNRSKWNAGIIVTGFTAATAQSMVITTADDAQERDPSSYIILGSNHPITSPQFSNGFADHWTFIAQGNLSLPSTRFTAGAPVNFSNSTSYSAYWIVFPSTKNSSVSLLQISEIQLHTGANATGSPIFNSSNTAICTGWNSATPTSEVAARTIDGTPTKYLNFGENNSGFFVVPGVGPTVIDSFQMTTANDSDNRDPATWTLHGMAANGLWTLIDSGSANLPTARNSPGPITSVTNTSTYLAYRMTFTTVRNAATANSMQVGEVQFFGTIIPRVDTDNDGMDDDWENLYGLTVGVNDAAGDLDSDGSTNSQEFQLRTIPNNPDSDGDGLLDGVETKTGVFVSASDTGTDPLKADSDNDTYPDGYEVARGTNPNNAASVPTITWDITPGNLGTGNSAIDGGAGTWNLSNGNWTTDNGANNIAWDNSGNRLAAIFSGTAGMVTIESPINADRVIVSSAGYNFSGGTLTLSGPNPRISIASGTTEMTNVLAGSAGLAKLGNGILRLSGPDSNTYSGTTILGDIGKLVLAKSSGQIAVPGDIYLNSTSFNGNNSGVVLAGNEQIADAAVLTWAGVADTYFRLNGFTETVAGLASETVSNFAVIENRGLGDVATYGNGSIIINTPGSDLHTFTGLIRNVDGGTGGGIIAITKSGTGTQVLAGNLSYTGTTTINDGELRVNGTLSGSNATVTGNGTLTGTGTVGLLVNVESGGTISPGIAGSGTLTTTAGVTLASGGTLTGAGTLAGPATVAPGGILTGTGVVTGAVTVQAGGTVEGSPTINGPTVIQSGGTLTGTATLTNSLTVQSGGLISPGGAAIDTINASGSVNLAGDAEFTVHKDGVTLTSDLLANFSAITYGGNLTVQATGDPLALGDSFQLFAPAGGATIGGSFANIDLPAPGSGLSWDVSGLLTTGFITLVDYAATPAFSLPAGGYVGAQTVSIIAETGATIYYTTDGSEPTLASPSGPSPITGLIIPTDSVRTLKAFATVSGLANSSVATAVYQTVTTAVWNVDDNGLWSETVKWLSEVSPNAIDAPVDFTFPESFDTFITLDSNRTVGSMTFANPLGFNWTINSSGGSILTLATTSGTPGIAVQENTTTIAAPIAGTQGLVKSGAGLLVLSGVNSYSGNTTINGGELSVGTFAANGTNSGLGSGSSLTLDGGSLRYTGGSVPVNVFNRAVTLGSGGGTFNFAASGFWFTSGVISGPGDLTKAGVGQLIIQAANTYEGTTQILEQEVQIRTLDSLGSTAGNTVVADGARLCAGGALVGTVLEPIVLNGMGGNNNGALQANDGGTTVTWGGNISLATDSGLGSTSGNIPFSISGPISGSGGLVKVTGNSVTLSGSTSNTYGGVTRLGGNGRLLLAKTGGAIAIPGNIELSSTAWNGNNSGIVLAGNELIADSAILTWTNTAFGGGAQADSFLRLNGFTETIGGLVSSGNGGLAVIENRGLGDATTYGTGTLIIHTTGSNTYTYNGGFRDMDAGTGGGAIALVKSGTGTQILSGSMSATGTTTVNQGTLVIQSTSQASATTVASGGTLMGGGTLTGPLSILTGGILSPGLDIGTFTAGNTILAGTYACGIDGAAVDRLTVNGSLDLTGSTLAFSEINAPTEASYVIASYTTTLTGTFAVTGLPDGYAVQYDSVEKQIKLVTAPAGGFAAWADDNELSGDPDADFDNDGLPDAVEFVLGTSPTESNGGGLSVSEDGANFVVTFPRSHASKTEDISISIDLGTDLQIWPDVYQVGDDTASSDEGITVSPQDDHDLITLSVPILGNTKRFAIMRVTVAAP